MKKFSLTFIAILIISMNAFVAFAMDEPDLVAQSAILMDYKTGKILYSKNEDVRMFPASTTKILTALVAMDYINLNEYLTVGQEINLIPLDSSIVGHMVGETITFETAVRSLIMRSGSDTAATVALEVARRHTNDRSLSYANAEKIFSELMNSKAEEIGAINSNFNNPHGLHDPNHYTTAYDMALISRHAMGIDAFKKISSEPSFKGNGAGSNPSPELKTQEYDWYSRNDLLVSSLYSYPYAVGIKTGFTEEAGDCLAGAAEKKDKMMITVVLNSPVPSRWEDTIKLFDYGFDNFDYETVQLSGEIIDEVSIDNFKLGEIDLLDVETKSEFGDIFSKEQLSRIQKSIEYVPELIAENKTDGDDTLKLTAPIDQGSVVANITYTLDGNVIFEDELLAARQVNERTFVSDMEYYINTFKNLAFSRMAIPFWIAGAIILFLVIRLFTFLANKKRSNYYRIRRRY